MEKTLFYNDLVQKLSTKPEYDNVASERLEAVDALCDLVRKEGYRLNRPEFPVNLNLLGSILFKLYSEMSKIDRETEVELDTIYSNFKSVRCLSFFGKDNIICVEDPSSQKRININIEEVIVYIFYELTDQLFGGQGKSLAQACFQEKPLYFEFLPSLLNWILEEPGDDQAALRAESLEHFASSYIWDSCLDVGLNALTSLPSCVSEYPLHKIEVTLPSTLLEIPECLSELKALEIEFAKNSTNSEVILLKHLSEFKNLTTLTLSLNNLTHIPEEIFALHRLESLYCYGSSLKELSPSIGKLKQLKTLELSGHQINKLPHEIGELLFLEKLDLSNNELTDLPESIGQLSNLKMLNLFSNQIHSIPGSIGGLSSLDEISLINNQLVEIPEALFHLPKIESLDLSRNKIQSLPEICSENKVLEDLDLSHNQLKEIPKGLNQILSLNRLNLNHNQISDLPEDLGELKALIALHLQNNPLKKLPSSMSQLNLKTFCIKSEDIDWDEALLPLKEISYEEFAP